MNYDIGAIWRKWDLHVHTPASFHWNGGSRFAKMGITEKSKALNEIAKSIEESDIAAFAIMDYWTFDGYVALRDHIRTNFSKFEKAVFPGIELRVEAPVDFRLNIHVILSDLLSNQEIQDFKNALRIGAINRTLSDEALVAFARTLDSSKARVHGYTGEYAKSEDLLLELGSKTAKITRESLLDGLKQIPEDSALILLPYDTSDGLAKLDWKGHAYDSNYFMQLAHIFETREPENVDLFLGRETPKNKDFIKNFLQTMGGKPKPVISGSDAHKVADYGKFPSNRITWVKADPTFEGLKQLVNEPAERCYIGEVPPKLLRVAESKTKYIRSLAIKKKTSSNLREKWFDSTILLNPGLVAVIGNKGKGKSAFTDILGLLSNSKQHEVFSFLSEKSFRNPRDNKAKHFEATLTWESGNSIAKSLDSAVDETQPELVKYIPQNFLETVCNEIGGEDETDFDRELKKVIFSHVLEADRLGEASLEDLIERKTSGANEAIALLKVELHQTNQLIVELEDKLRPEYKKNLENLLVVKQQELDSVEKSKPEVVLPPQNDPTKQQEIEAVAAQIEAAKKQRDEFEAQTSGLRPSRQNMP